MSAEKSSKGGDVISKLLNDEDQRVLRHWRESLTLQDIRYGGKGLLLLAHWAMVDSEFRSRLVNDTDAFLRELQLKLNDLPEGVTLTFLENTKSTLNVVLPPPAGEMAYRSPTLREVLRSRTTPETRWFQDDFDMGDLGDAKGPMPGADGGDPDSIDPPIFK